MAEAILAHLGGDRFIVRSAGSDPAGFVHPLALAAMDRMHVPVSEDATSKSWDQFADESFDAVITLCDQAASEVCPIPPERGARAHWSLPDPVFLGGREEDRVELACRVAERLRAKIEGLIEIDWSQTRADVEERLAFLGEI